jgi:hypothetical protein
LTISLIAAVSHIVGQDRRHSSGETYFSGGTLPKSCGTVVMASPFFCLLRDKVAWAFMKCSAKFNLAFATVATLLGLAGAPAARAEEKKPNILVIMGDDIGRFNLGSYNSGIMLNATPNLDKLALQGMRFTDYYAEASCTAGRANFITGELPIRTGLTTVSQAGSALSYPDAAPSIADALKAMGYSTGQFGKNHLGNRNPTLPCMHGFDEYFGYLYHLNAMEDPFYYTYPPVWKATVGPRDLIHCWRMQTIRRSKRAGARSSSRSS